MEKEWNEEKEKKEREFEECCEEYMPLVYSAIRRYNLQNNREEFLQIGRIALFEAWRNYDPNQGPFAPYAKSYVYGRIKESLYKDNRWNTNQFPMEPLTMTEVMGTQSQVDDQQRIVIEDWLKRSILSEREQLWVKESILNGLNTKDICEKYGVGVPTVKSWKRFALMKLREIW
ncbi:sigma-70 family RNA polymerase sigma factor [Evansella tamaricis]|uniref:Sigma-70 family RNA polymerase sigma factor n=1 Tax=Evansella tamaricis TaxID=2069301 RepID=A0ABS6JIL6_9BACI|nr:sigma-70 family RNA polymerase sigma factor [Evansella tamaricis]MBU9713502.1 sigma-70 family RNA polymerase sigma factor [Evansella tamaricis]